MRRQPDEPEMMGAREAARTLGVQQSNLRAIVGLPEPYQRIASGTLYRADEIRALAYERASRKARSITATPPPAKETTPA